MPYAGLGARVIAMRQSFTEIEPVPGESALQDRWGLGVAAGPVAGIELPAFQPTFAYVQAELQGRYLPVQGQGAFSAGIEGVAGFGVQF